MRERAIAFGRRSQRVAPRPDGKERMPCQRLHVWAGTVNLGRKMGEEKTHLNARNYAHLFDSFLVIWMLHFVSSGVPKLALQTYYDLSMLYSQSSCFVTSFAICSKNSFKCIDCGTIGSISNGMDIDLKSCTKPLRFVSISSP